MYKSVISEDKTEGFYILTVASMQEKFNKIILNNL